MTPQRILIVDDQSDLRLLVRLALAPLDAEIQEAANGMDALIAIRTFKPDVIVLDVMLPGGIDGYQICQAVKQDPLTRSIKVIMLSARGQVADIEEGQRVQADRYIVKPFSPLALLEVVRG
jgi:CheY-like chemotaxis protein